MKKILTLLAIIAVPWCISAQSIGIGTDAVITIEAGASISVGTAATAGPIINTDNAGLVIKSSASGSGSLICSGTPNATVERFIDVNAWHMVTPVTDPSTGWDFWDENSDSWLMFHTESSNAWDYIIDRPTPLDRHNGYAYRIDAAGSPHTVTFHGTLLGAHENVSLTNAGERFNLLGNPFPCTVEFDGDWNFSNVEQSVWLWEEANGNYTLKTIAGGPADIPMGQGFFMRATTSSFDKIVTIPVSARKHSSQAFYKNADTETEYGYTNYMTIRANNNQYSDVVQISFGDNGSDDFEDGWDGSKIFGNEEAPQLYLVESERKQSFDHLATLSGTDSKTIAMSYVAGIDGTQSFVANTEHLQYVDVVLEDLDNGTTQDLRAKPVYSFTASKGDSPGRFHIHFAWSPDGIDDPIHGDKGDVKIYSYGNSVYIKSKGDALNADGELSIYDIHGHTLVRQQLNRSALQSVSLNFSSYNYVIVKVSKQGQVYIEKVILK